MSEKIFQADLRLLELEGKLNKVFREYSGDQYFLLVFSIEDIMSEYSDWPGDKDHLFSTVDQIIGRIYTGDPLIEDHCRHNAFSRILPDNFTCSDINTNRLVGINLTEEQTKYV